MVSMTEMALCALLSCCSSALPLIAFQTLPQQPITISGQNVFQPPMSEAPVAVISTSSPPIEPMVSYVSPVSSSTLFEIAPAPSTTTPSTVSSSDKQPTTSSQAAPTLVVTTTVTSPIIEITDVEDTTTATATITSVLTVYLPEPTTDFFSSSPSSSTVWSAPPQMTDLSAFNVTNFGGRKNLQVVQGIPADASAATFAFDATATGVSTDTWTNDTSVLQIFYPANSVNPGNKDRPQGGSQFYAAPINITDANNVTMEYDVFFPNDFDFVQGGKLPGLYGGHAGCSGGNDADDCFSTRLMWRPNGAGELYLYAPKDRQTDDLCDDPQSVCDTAYGFSLGRGSFTYAQGAWTEISQTVVLNTPGKQDGCLALDVNGERVIDRKDVYFRRSVGPKPDDDIDNDGEGGLLGGILGGIVRRAGWKLVNGVPRLSIQNEAAAKPKTEVGFIGIFFSTFFGGHKDSWATPKDQYSWFKDFSLSVNS